MTASLKAGNEGGKNLVGTETETEKAESYEIA